MKLWKYVHVSNNTGVKKMLESCENLSSSIKKLSRNNYTARNLYIVCFDPYIYDSLNLYSVHLFHSLPNLKMSQLKTYLKSFRSSLHYDPLRVTLYYNIDVQCTSCILRNGKKTLIVYAYLAWTPSKRFKTFSGFC